MFKITIPKPCHEDWAAMTEVEQGRHCNACAKTVVDFTAMNDDEVKNFFLNKTGEKVCGRFTGTQLQRVRINISENIFYIQLPLWKRFLVACLLVFSATLFSCDAVIEGDNVVGKIVPVSDTTVAVPQKPDTTKAIPVDSIISCTPTTVGFTMPQIVTDIKGDIAIEPVNVIDTIVPPVVVPPEIVKGEVAPVPVKKDTTKCSTQQYY